MLILIQLIVVISLVSKSQLLQVVRQRDGDKMHLVPCDAGTIIVKNNAYHSVYCARSLQEAGCDLTFSSTTNIGFVPSNSPDFKQLQVQSQVRPICSYSFQPVIGKMFIQDYPSNINKDVWITYPGVQKVNNTLNYTVEGGKITIRFTEHWNGILMKIFVDCIDQQGIKDKTNADRRCMLIKYEGYVQYPLTTKSFNIPSTTSKLQTTKPVPGKVINSSISRFAPITNREDDIWIYAVFAAVGAFVILLAVFITIYIICKRRRLKRNKSVINTADSEEESTTQNNYNSTAAHQFPSSHPLTFSPVVSTDSRVPAGSNYVIDTTGAKRTTNVYTGDNIAYDDDFNKFKNDVLSASKGTRMKMFKNVKFDTELENQLQNTDARESLKMQSVKMKKRPTVDFVDNADVRRVKNENCQENNVSVTSSPALENRYRLKNFDITKNKNHAEAEPIQVELPSTYIDCYDKTTVMSRLAYAEENDAYEGDLGVATSRIRSTHVEGHSVYDDDQDSANSESIEAMFSFSNDEISIDDEFEEEGENVLENFEEETVIGELNTPRHMKYFNDAYEEGFDREIAGNARINPIYNVDLNNFDTVQNDIVDKDGNEVLIF